MGEVIGYRLNFATSEHADPLRRLKLEVTYLPKTLTETCITYVDHIQDALLHGLISEVNVNYGLTPQLAASAWTFNGVPGNVRALFGFNGSRSRPGPCSQAHGLTSTRGTSPVAWASIRT